MASKTGSGQVDLSNHIPTGCVRLVHDQIGVKGVGTDYVRTGLKIVGMNRSYPVRMT